MLYVAAHHTPKLAHTKRPQLASAAVERDGAGRWMEAAQVLGFGVWGRTS